MLSQMLSLDTGLIIGNVSSFLLEQQLSFLENNKFNKSSVSLSQRTEYLSGDSLYFVDPILDVEWEEKYLKLKNYGLNVGGAFPATDS